MFHHHHTNLAVVLTIFIACTTRAQNLTCNRHCGGQTLQFPFGFSKGCPIQLNCSNNQVQLFDFLVQNVTNSNIFVNLPAKCNRGMQSIVRLFAWEWPKGYS
ncbi:Wall-associated receptor kinase 14 [Spatholobus suberectus]|nr:Wall-associated receptor kinase 14 [Spatholobus suberectus]